MSNNSSGTGSNGSRMEVPQAKEAMDRFKMEVASEIGCLLYTSPSPRDRG